MVINADVGVEYMILKISKSGVRLFERWFSFSKWQNARKSLLFTAHSKKCKCWTVGFTDSEMWSINITLSEKDSLHWNLNRPCLPEKNYDN